MGIFIPMPDSNKIVPDGVYLVVFDKKILGKFKTLDEAQKFQSGLGHSGSRIVRSNVRAKMTEEQINIAQKVVDDWGKWDAGNKKPLS